MGTRHIISIKKDYKFKVFNYGQWDGYPDGQGVDLLDILHGSNLDHLSAQVDKIKTISDEKYFELWKDIGVDIKECNGFLSMEESNRFKKKNPQLNRDMGANILKYIYENEEPILLPPSLGNGLSDTWCEWFYVIDLDKMKLSVFDSYIFEYEGLEIDDDNIIYLEQKARGVFDLENLPTEEEFLSVFKIKE